MKNVQVLDWKDFMGKKKSTKRKVVELSAGIIVGYVAIRILFG